MVPGQILGCSCCDGGASSRSENKTCLVAAGPPGWAVAGMTVTPGARRSAAVSWAARHGVHGRARLEAAHGDDLLPQPNLESECAGSQVEDGVGTIVERVERGDHATAPDPDEAGAEEISWELAWCRELPWQLVTQIASGQRKSRSIQRFFF
jgi:hypothetical protein